MRIFLSYPSDERPVAERLNLALLAHGHDVFFDRADLEAGLEYDQAIARAIADADLFIFFVTPRAVEPGRYTLTELGLAEQRWPHPGGRVLPVMVRPTDMAAVPAYARAVNIFTPRGEVVAETTHQVQRLARSHRLGARTWRRAKSPLGIVALVTIAALGTVAWLTREIGILGSTVVRLPADVRAQARAVAAMADSGFVVAATSPPRLVRFSESGVQVGEPEPLMGEPVSVARTVPPTQLLVITRGRDGVMVFDTKRLRVVDSTLLDPSLVRPARGFVNPPRRSGDIESVVAFKGDLWVTTGDRDGEPTVLRYRATGEQRWEVPTWTVDTAGFGRDAMGVRLRLVGDDLWGVRVRGNPSTLYHLVNPFLRIDRFNGSDLRLVSCATDVAASATGNLLFLSCDNELQEVSVQAKQLTLVRTWPALPIERAPGTVMHHLFAADSAGIVVAFNTEESPPNDGPVRAQVIVMDSARTATVLNEPGAVVRSLAVTPRSVVAVLRRADGSSDVIVLPRGRGR